jgi:hypothetical protein
VYAGLPFIRLYGQGVAGDLGIHGPVSDFRSTVGGRLRRGNVSHGCIRMQASDILDVYARVRGRAFKVKVQREVEHRPDGSRVDVPDSGLLSECRTDGDCRFPGGFCRIAPGGSRGFCTGSCTGTCPAREDQGPVVCIRDGGDATRGLCTVREDPTFAHGCRRFGTAVRPSPATRFGNKGGRVSACLPSGWNTAPGR